MDRLAKAYDRASQQLDKRIGNSARYTQITPGALDIETGIQTPTYRRCDVKVRALPLSVRERLDLSAAGLHQVDARWAMRAHYISDVNPGDELRVGGLDYLVLTDPASTLDEFRVEWTLFTRRMRT